MNFDAVAEKLDGIPHMRVDQGRKIYDHIRAERPANVLEIGTANGVGSSYMAAALEANGAGKVTTLDRTSASYEPGPAVVLGRVGLAHRVDLIRNPDSS